MIRPKGLGRGLDALLGGTDDTPNASGEALQTIAIDRLRAGKYQPRTRMDEASLAELADSIREQGIMQPILVRPIDNGRFEIIAGERRWRAAQLAGLRDIPALVKTVPDNAALALALIENIQREDLNPLEEAQGLARLIAEFGLTHDAAAKAVGRSRSAVSNLLRLTGLAPAVQEYLLSGAIEMGHARALLALDEPDAIERAARQVVERQLSVRATEALVKKGKEPEDRKPPARPQKSASVRDLEERLTRALGGPVAITEDQPGQAGRIEIRYMNLDHLERLLDRLL
jgi:ParB family chromosome partitioning protein